MTNICSIFVGIKSHVHITIIFEHTCRLCSSAIINNLKLSMKYLQSNAIPSNGDITFNFIQAVSTGEYDGGKINLDAGGNITGTPGEMFDTPVSGIASFSPFSNGGAINIESGGNVSLYGDLISSGSDAGGNIRINANGDITTGSLQSVGGSVGGEISLTSDIGIIDSSYRIEFGELTIGGIIDASSPLGIGGSIEFNSQDSITPADEVVTTNNSINFNGPVNLTSNNLFAGDTVRIQTSNNTIVFAGNITGSRGLEIEGGENVCIHPVGNELEHDGCGRQDDAGR